MESERRALKVDFVKWWPNFDRERNFFVDALRAHFEVEIGTEPDILFFSVFQGEFPAGDYIRVFYTGEPRRPDMSMTDWAFSYAYDEDFGHLRHMRLPLYTIDVDGRAFREDWARGLVKPGDYADRVLDEARGRFCAYVAYYDGAERCAMFDRLSQYREVTAPGRSRNNASPISDGDPEHSRANEDFQRLKRAWYRNFRFALVFENRCYPGYTTEKLVDAMMAGCIPIYWGNPDVVRDFNPRSFVNVNAYETEEARFPRWFHQIPALHKVIRNRFFLPRALDRAAARVQEIERDPALRLAVLAEPWFHDNRPNRYFDRQRLVDRMREIGLDALSRRTEPTAATGSRAI